MDEDILSLEGRKGGRRREERGEGGREEGREGERRGGENGERRGYGRKGEEVKEEREW